MEKIANSTQLLDAWVNKSFIVAKGFVRDMMKILGRAIRVLEIVHNLMVTVDAFTHTKDVTIPVLQAIRKAPRQILAKEGVIRKEATPNLLQWSTLLQMKKLLFEDVSNKCNQVEDIVHPIHDKVIEVMCVILDKKAEIETNVDIQELEDKIKVIRSQKNNWIICIPLEHR